MSNLVVDYLRFGVVLRLVVQQLLGRLMTWWIQLKYLDILSAFLTVWGKRVRKSGSLWPSSSMLNPCIMNSCSVPFWRHGVIFHRVVFHTWSSLWNCQMSAVLTPSAQTDQNTPPCLPSMSWLGLRGLVIPVWTRPKLSFCMRPVSRMMRSFRSTHLCRR